ncbi:MAG: MATE family efflux transporter [Myxococcales bacterium]|nr:MATE family efflux transporter [Sorangiineae bacterium PRO1]MCL4754394.1 MATE family efflux transporter [Myxococcales bacterium]
MTDGGERIRKGAIPFEVARFGAPLALGMGLQVTFNLVDAYLISRLPHETAGPALGAIGICDQLAALGTIVSYGLSVATGAIVSRRQGAGDVAGVRAAAWQSLLLVLGLSLAFALAGVLGARFLLADVVGAKGRVAELGAEYLSVMLGGSFTIFLLLHLTTLQRALGSSKTPASLLVAANVLNFLFAVLLVYGPGEAPAVFSWGPPIARALGLPRLELMGAAWATVLARVVVLIPLWLILTRRFGLFGKDSRARPDLPAMSSLWRVGWPSSTQLVVRIAAMLVMHSLVARAYTTSSDQSATTALGIVFRLETMALFVGLGWGSAAQTFVGQNLGAGTPERARQSGWYAALYNAAMMALLALAYRAFGHDIIAFFDRDARVIDVGQSYVAAVGFSYVGLGIGIVLGAAIQGAGATKQTLGLDSAVVFAFQLPAAWLVVFGLGLPLARLWQVIAWTYVAFAAVYVLSYRRGRFLETAAL